MLRVLLVLEPQLPELRNFTQQTSHELSNALVYFSQILLNMLDFSQQSRFVPAQVPNLVMQGNYHVDYLEKTLPIFQTYLAKLQRPRKSLQLRNLLAYPRQFMHFLPQIIVAVTLVSLPVHFVVIVIVLVFGA